MSDFWMVLKYICEEIAVPEDIFSETYLFTCGIMLAWLAGLAVLGMFFVLLDLIKIFVKWIAERKRKSHEHSTRG